MLKNLWVAHFLITVLMLIILLLPLPWVYYERGHYLTGLYLVLTFWASIRHLLVWPPTSRHLFVLSLEVFTIGFALLILSYLLSALLMPPWLKRLRRMLVAITMLAVLGSLTLSRLVAPKLLTGFWLAVGMVGVAGLIELAEYVVSRSRAVGP